MKYLLARRFWNQRFLADFYKVFGTPADVRKHERAANRALVVLRWMLCMDLGVTR